MAKPIKEDEIMNQRCNSFFTLVMVAIISTACGPTDAGIGTQFKTNLTADETVKAAQIEVSVQKKVVTLSGTVNNQAVKERAVAVARGTNGVAEVVDQITVKNEGYGPNFGHGREMMERGRLEEKRHSPGAKGE